MNLTHLSIAIVVIIAVIVAATIAAFSVVTFASLDKAVTNAMTSELDYVRSSMLGLIERTVRPARTMRNLFLTNGWTTSKLPVRDASRTQVGTVATELANWTGAFDVLVENIRPNAELWAFVYSTTVSAADPYTWSDFAAQIIADTGDAIVLFPDGHGNVSYFNGTVAPPWNLSIIENLAYNSTGATWQIYTAALTRAEWNVGSFHPTYVYFNPLLATTVSLLTFGHPARVRSRHRRLHFGDQHRREHGPHEQRSASARQ